MASQPDDTLDKEALLQQLGTQPDAGAAAMSQDPQGNWQLQEHGNTRALQGQEVADAKKYVSDLAAQRQPQVAAPVAEGAPMGMAAQPVAKQMPTNPLAAIGGALKPSAVLNPLSAQNPLAPKNVAQALSPQGINRVLGPQAIGQALAPKNVHQNMKNILNPRNILHPKEAFRRIFGGG